MTANRPRQLVPGTRVQVRNQFDGSWSSGFELWDAADDGRYRVRRLSDHSVLPVTFRSADVRPEAGMPDLAPITIQPAPAGERTAPIRPADGDRRVLAGTGD